MKAQKKVFIGDYWVDSPQSQYGGMWVVIAEDKIECYQLLQDFCTEYELDGYSEDLASAIDKAKVFDLMETNEVDSEGESQDSVLLGTTSVSSETTSVLSMKTERSSTESRVVSFFRT